MRLNGEAGRGLITLVVSVATTASLVAIMARGGRAAPPTNLVPGGGSGKSDCYIEYDIKGAPAGDKNKISCLDGDPACDATPSGANGCDDTCTFSIALCPNQTDPNLPKCTKHNL